MSLYLLFSFCFLILIVKHFFFLLIKTKLLYHLFSLSFSISMVRHFSLFSSRQSHSISYSLSVPQFWWLGIFRCSYQDESTLSLILFPFLNFDGKTIFLCFHQDEATLSLILFLFLNFVGKMFSLFSSRRSHSITYSLSVSQIWW